MTTRVFVISDLHLGGREGFRMCERAGQAKLAAFLRWVAGHAGAGAPVHLVVAGDIVDFLAEANPDETWSAFTADEDLADRKLERILEDTAEVWDAMAACVRGGTDVTILCGNHDIELSLPKLRRRLRRRLGPGSVELLYDNQAFTLGKLLVEHGNRYEGWNVVDHDALRRVRSRLSRGEPAGEFRPQPGSELVVRVMNKLKRRYAWVDLLKPETSGVIPILAVLETGLWRRVGPAIETAARAAWRQSQFGASGMPTRDSFIAEHVDPGDANAPAGAFPDEDIFAWVHEQLRSSDSSFISELDELKQDLLFSALRTWAAKDGHTYCVDREHALYLDAARTLASRGHDVVVFGHSHHVKRVRFGEPGTATYLNTGTWADLMRIPEPILSGDESQARPAFGRFLDDLRANRIDSLRRSLPTFAQVDVHDDGHVEHADVYFFDEGAAPVRVETSGMLERRGAS